MSRIVKGKFLRDALRDEARGWRDSGMKNPAPSRPEDEQQEHAELEMDNAREQGGGSR